MSTVAEALARVDRFEQTVPTAVAWNINRFDTLKRLREIIRQPDIFDQRGLNACGPAVFFRIWLARDPVAVADFACALLRDGHALIGTLQVAPSWKLLSQNYAALRSATNAAHPNVTPEHAEWMMLSALRDSENIIIDYAGEPFTLGDKLAGITLPGSIASWLMATGLYAGIADETNFVGFADPNRLLGMIPTSDLDVVLLINAAVVNDALPTIPNTAPPSRLFLSPPDHYVLLTAPLASSTDGSWLNLDLWCWGKINKGWQGLQRFGSGYFGMLVARTP